MTTNTPKPEKWITLYTSIETTSIILNILREFLRRPIIAKKYPNEKKKVDQWHSTRLKRLQPQCSKLHECIEKLPIGQIFKFRSVQNDTRKFKYFLDRLTVIKIKKKKKFPSRPFYRQAKILSKWTQ